MSEVDAAEKALVQGIRSLVVGRTERGTQDSNLESPVLETGDTGLHETGASWTVESPNGALSVWVTPEVGTILRTATRSLSTPVRKSTSPRRAATTRSSKPDRMTSRLRL